MNGELAQVAALVAHARVALSSRSPFSLDLSNSTFKFVRDLTFDQELRRFLREPLFRQIGSTPAQWYEYLVRSDARSVALTPRPSGGVLADHVAVAFAGGGSWGIGVVEDGRNKIWRAHWHVGNPNAPDRRIWSVHYREFEGERPPSEGITVATAHAKLARILTDAEDFAREAKLAPWPDLFAAAHHKLGAEAPTFEYHPDILPSSMYTNNARRLFAACERAWVFGGMGSWNDLVFREGELQRRYDAITGELYTAVLDGIVASVNEK